MKAIKTEIPRGAMGVSAIDQREIDAVTEVLKNPGTMFRHRGDNKTQCDLFESEAVAYTGAKHALFVSSGTQALVCCLSALEIGPGDEVIVPAYTFIATAAAVVDVGAIPVIAEIDESLGISPDSIRKNITPYTKAIIAVHMQSIPCKMDEIHAIAKEKGLYVIEDCCQALGVKYKGQHVGMRSDAFAWSLNFYKNITSGEGGVFYSNDSAAFQRGVFQSDPGMTMWDTRLNVTDPSVRPFSRGGYRASEITAAIARVQLSKLDDIVNKTRSLKKVLLAGLNKPINYTLQHVDDPEGDAGLSFCMIMHNKELAEKMTEGLNDEGLRIGSVYNGGFPDRHVYSNWTSVIYKIGATPAGYPWKDPAYKGNVEYSPDMCPQTLSILARALRLTLNINMTNVNMEEFANAINIVDARI